MLQRDRHGGITSGLSRDRIEPCDPGEPGEVGVGGDEGQSVLTGESGQGGVWHEIARRVILLDDLSEDLLMPGTRYWNPGGWPGEPVLNAQPGAAPAAAVPSA